MEDKDTKYLQFPLCLMNNIFTDKKGTLDKIFDVIIVLIDNKNIVTIYLNGKNDNHETLNASLYCKATQCAGV